MKRKSLTLMLLIPLFISLTKTVKAQAVSGNVNVNIVLSNAFSIVLGALPGGTFTYATALDYAASKLIPKVGEFTVVSNIPYSVAVKANSVFNTISGTTPPLSAVHVYVDPTTITGGTYSNVALSLANQTIASAASATIGTLYNIDYEIPSATPLLAMTSGTYTTTIVYTVTQP